MVGHKLITVWGSAWLKRYHWNINTSDEFLIVIFLISFNDTINTQDIKFLLIRAWILGVNAHAYGFTPSTPLIPVRNSWQNRNYLSMKWTKKTPKMYSIMMICVVFFHWKKENTHKKTQCKNTKENTKVNTKIFGWSIMSVHTQILWLFLSKCLSFIETKTIFLNGFAIQSQVGVLRLKDLALLTKTIMCLILL